MLENSAVLSIHLQPVLTFSRVVITYYLILFIFINEDESKINIIIIIDFFT